MSGSPKPRYSTPLKVEASELVSLGHQIIDRSIQDPETRANCGEDLRVATLTWNLEPIFCSIDRYVAGELDFTSPAEHGYGRVPGDLPRLGAYHRAAMARLGPVELAALRDLIVDIMLASYVGACVFLRPPTEPHGEAKESFFLAWSRKIYVSKIDENFRLVGEFCGHPGQERLSAFLHAQGLIRGQVGERDMTPLLTSYYSFAGWGLRLTEINPHPNRSRACD